MSGFIATAATPATESEIDAGPFWPRVNPPAVRAAMRLDGTVAPDRLRASLVAAVALVNGELRPWAARQQAAGWSSLGDVPSEQIDGASRLVHLYLRAVGCCAAAELAERYRSYDATDAGNQRADDLTPSIDELRRDQRWAIRDLKGERHVTVELI